MLSWSNALSKGQYNDYMPSANDSDDTLTLTWTAWVKQESFKRIVIHTAIYDSQVSMAHLKNPLISPAQMLLPLPAPRKLWLAQNAHSWRNQMLQIGPAQSSLPSIMSVVNNLRALDDLEHVIDKQLCILAIIALLNINADQIPPSIMVGWPRLLQVGFIPSIHALNRYVS